MALAFRPQTMPSRRSWVVPADDLGLSLKVSSLRPSLARQERISPHLGPAAPSVPRSLPPGRPYVWASCTWIPVSEARRLSCQARAASRPSAAPRPRSAPQPQFCLQSTSLSRSYFRPQSAHRVTCSLPRPDVPDVHDVNGVSDDVTSAGDGDDRVSEGVSVTSKREPLTVFLPVAHPAPEPEAEAEAENETGSEEQVKVSRRPCPVPRLNLESRPKSAPHPHNRRKETRDQHWRPNHKPLRPSTPTKPRQTPSRPLSRKLTTLPKATASPRSLKGSKVKVTTPRGKPRPSSAASPSARGKSLGDSNHAPSGPETPSTADSAGDDARGETERVLQNGDGGRGTPPPPELSSSGSEVRSRGTQSSWNGDQGTPPQPDNDQDEDEDEDDVFVSISCAADGLEEGEREEEGGEEEGGSSREGEPPRAPNASPRYSAPRQFRPESAPPCVEDAQPSQRPIIIPVATTYDLEVDHAQIMSQAISSYHRHCSQERAEDMMRKQRQLQATHRRDSVHSPRPPRSPRTPGPPTPRPRPWSALPQKFDTSNLSFRQLSEANVLEKERGQRRVLNVRKITLDIMEPGEAPMTRAAAYIKRNRTTHTWNMSQSYPSSSFLHSHMQSHHYGRSPSSSSPSSHTPSSSLSSPRVVKAKDPTKRPSSAYAYDGGFFNPCSPRRDWFVIDPEWVSDAMAVQKINLTDRQDTQEHSATRKSRGQSRPARRCRSAPPPKRRNPITWAE